MVRDDLYITIPNLFRCPISLDVMKSPVSLCTGVTYDRSNIQRWIDNGNNTCPATMQVLQSKDFVPNRNLQRLIQIWSDSVRQRVDSAASTESESISSQDQVVELMVDIESNKRDSTKCYDSLLKLVCFAEESEENRRFLGKIDGLVPLLVDFLGNVNDGDYCIDIKFVEQIVRILDLIRNEIQDKEQLMNSILKSSRDCLCSLVHVLKQGNEESQIASVRILDCIAIDAECKLLIAEKDELLPELIKQIGPDKDPSLIKSALSCLISISMTKRIKIKLVHLGAIKPLTRLLLESDSSAAITEKVLKLLETASSVREGRIQICEDSICVPAVVHKVLKVSNSATEHAVTILWSVCYLFRDQKAQEAVTKSNGLTKILLIMQSNCSPSVRQMASDLLKIFRINSKSYLSSYDTNTTHIMPC